MNVSSERNVMVFKYTNEDRVSYSIGLSKKNEQGEYERAYFPARFRSGVSLDNQTKIKIKEGWLTFNNYEDAEGKNKTYHYIFVNEFELVDGEHKEEKQPKEEKDPFEDFGEQQAIELDDDSLPF